MRPELDAVQDPTDITGWYWTKSELIQIARRLGVPRSGSKQDLIEAITASLAGQRASHVAAEDAGKFPPATVRRGHGHPGGPTVHPGAAELGG
jgi:hypothetical protein